MAPYLHELKGAWAVIADKILTNLASARDGAPPFLVTLTKIFPQ